MDRYVFQTKPHYAWLKVLLVFLICIFWGLLMVLSIDINKEELRDIPQPVNKEFDWRPDPNRTFRS